MKSQRLKVVFTGCVGAGKTTAIDAISEIDPISTDVKSTESSVLERKSSTTVAMDYGELTLDAETKLYLYGTPGQRRFDFMSHVLMKGALGLVILIDNSHKTPLEELDYYLNLNAEFLTVNPAVIGITHYDEISQPTVDDYYNVLKEHGDFWPVIQSDARKPEDVVLLLHTLLAILEYS